MQAILRALRELGPVGNLVANLLTFLTTNWVVTMTTVVSLYASTTDWLVDFVQKPAVQTFVFVFLAVLWTWIGVTYLVDRHKPVKTTPAHDYRYGLTTEGLVITRFDVNDEKIALQFGMQFRNFSSGPIKYNVEQFDVRIGTRSLPKLVKGKLFGYLPRGGAKISVPDAFSKSDIAEFLGKEVKGTAEIVVTYGHPEHDPVRRLSIAFDLTLQFNKEGPFGFGATFAEETDVDIRPHDIR